MINPMEEDQEVKHVCKFCSKSFPCGRSLGGHMRSHVTNASTENEEKVSAPTIRKLSSFNSNGGDTCEAGVNNGGYGLRENPKKTWRFTDSSEDTAVLDKFCKECGKGFHSWKALFGHMKCHSDRERVTQNNTFLDDQDSWTNNNNNGSHKMVLELESQSENEASAPNRRRRSKRRRTRYMDPSTSSISFVSEAEQEQEEVAMSLMMLSRDLSPWCGLNSVAESSGNNSMHFELEGPSLVPKVEGKRVISSGSEMAKKVTKPRDMKWEFGNSAASNLNSKGKKSSELLATECPENGFGVNKTKDIGNEFIRNGKDKKPELELDSQFEFEDNGTEFSNSKYTSIKAKLLDSEMKSSSLKSWANKTSEAEFSKSSHKRGKFECTTCNKIFQSYQALGGHRASHKKIKGCFASKNASSENSTELEADLSPDPTTESKLMKNNNTIDNNENVEEHEMVTTIGFDNEEDTVRGSKKSKGHECPICLKVFPSGQALGGHKRSHLAGGSESTRNCQSQTIVLEEATPEIRDFFDLNLPASTEEDSNSHNHAEPYRTWWVVGGNNKQEALVGLMSN
ncbi:uncharacterized protein LOC113852386 [Abrus precatorius]|uniref:Uncharacterized protein LOC113852386 n=1 Tax=Abrus precatorius TaxID=3816 RepID=A0A8B8K435_ABRPR|nr:uncharacterized protein LOC113852386 [Abrus precatorius]